MRGFSQRWGAVGCQKAVPFLEQINYEWAVCPQSQTFLNLFSFRKAHPLSNGYASFFLSLFLSLSLSLSLLGILHYQYSTHLKLRGTDPLRGVLNLIRVKLRAVSCELKDGMGAFWAAFNNRRRFQPLSPNPLGLA